MLHTGFFIERESKTPFWGFKAGPQILQNFRRRDGKTFVRRDGRLDTDTAAYHPPSNRFWIGRRVRNEHSGLTAGIPIGLHQRKMELSNHG